MINSEVFTVWEPHFSHLQEVVTAFGRSAGKITTLGKQLIAQIRSILTRGSGVETPFVL